jgi:hypothetical protein
MAEEFDQTEGGIYSAETTHRFDMEILKHPLRKGEAATNEDLKAFVERFEPRKPSFRQRPPVAVESMQYPDPWLWITDLE